MTKAILMKSVLACLILSAQFSCAKKEPVRAAAKPAAANTKLDPKKAVTKTETPAEVKTETPVQAKTETESDDTAKVATKEVAKPVKVVETKKTAEAPIVAKDAVKPVVVVEPKKTPEAVPVVTKETAKPATATDNKSDLKFTEIKILDQSLLNSIKQDDPRVLFENYLTLDNRSNVMIAKRKYGMACKFQVKSELVQKDILKFKEIRKSTALNANGDQAIIVVFANETKTLNMYCNYQGDLTQKYFEENFYDVIDFKAADGKFKSDVEKKLTYAEITQKIKTLKMLDAKKLSDAGIIQDQQERFGIIAGQLVEETKSILAVKSGRAKQACALIGVVGNLENGRVYEYLDNKPGVSDVDNNYATMQINYGSETDKSQFTIECSLRRNGIGPEILFETFAGIFEYGVAVPKPEVKTEAEPKSEAKTEAESLVKTTTAAEDTEF